MRFEPQIEQKCLAVNSDEWNVLTSSLPFTQENCSDLIEARVLNAAPCQRLHLEQWQLKMGPSSPTMRYSIRSHRHRPVRICSGIGSSGEVASPQLWGTSAGAVSLRV